MGIKDIKQTNIVGITLALLLISLFANMAVFVFDGGEDLNLKSDLGLSSLNTFIDVNIVNDNKTEGNLYGDYYGGTSDWDETDLKEDPKEQDGILSFVEQIINIGKFLDVYYVYIYKSI